MTNGKTEDKIKSVRRFALKFSIRSIEMLGNFTYCNPTKLYFGKDALDGLNAELPKYGKNVLLVYGGGSIKKNGIYDKVVAALKANGKEIFEDGLCPIPR